MNKRILHIPTGNLCRYSLLSEGHLLYIGEISRTLKVDLDYYESVISDAKWDYFWKQPVYFYDGMVRHPREHAYSKEEFELIDFEEKGFYESFYD